VFAFEDALAPGRTDWERTIRVDLSAVHECCRAAAPGMCDRRFGRIVSISSNAGVIAFRNMASYCAAKAGIIGLTRALAVDLGSFGVTVNVVAPGSIAAGMGDASGWTSDPRMRSWDVARTPLRRVGSPEDVAGAVAFLVSEDASWITGQTLWSTVASRSTAARNSTSISRDETAVVPGTPDETIPATMTALEAMRAVFDAWEAGDPEALRALFTSDGVYLDPLKAGPLEGPDAIVEDNRAAMAAIRECRISVSLAIEDGDRAVVEGGFASELVDSGARFDFPFVAIAEMSEGRIRRLAEYFDTGPLR
jgi:ketosteroid isomerase-like protein